MIKQVGVLGAGQMGSGIAQLFARQGFSVVLFDAVAVQLGESLNGIEQDLRRQAEKGVLAAAAVPATLERIRTTGQMEDLADCDLAIAAAGEGEPVTFEVFQRLDQLIKPGAILAAHAASIPITRIATATRRPEQVIGLHFMQPVPVMKRVEVIHGIATSEETFAAIAALVAKLGKAMAVSADYPAFLLPMINEAAFALYEGAASAEDIDKGMKLGSNQPMGPLTLADFIGLDTCLATLDVLYHGLKDSKYHPCPLLVQMVAAGRLGRKSGRGFFTYGGGEDPVEPAW